MATNLGSAGTVYIDLELAKNKLKASFDEAKRDISGSMQKLGASMTSAGTTMSMALTLPIVGLGAAVAKVAGDFEVEMNRVKALSGATGAQFETLRDQARELGATTQFSASQAAEGMGFLAQAGFETEEIMSAMPATLSLAAAAQIELGTAADVASNILSGYGMQAGELEGAMDSLIVVTSKSNTNFVQLGEAMKYAGPVAKSAGMEFEEAAAMIGLMGNAGIQGTMAGTSLRGAMTRLLNPTKAAEDAMAKLGLRVTDSNGRLLPMRDILEQLGDKTEETGAFMEIFGQRAGPAMAAAATQGVDAFDKLIEAQENELGIMGDLEQAYAESLPGKLKALRSAFEELLLVIAEAGVLDAFKGLIEGARELTVKISQLDPRMIKAAAGVAAVAAAIGPLLIVVGTLVSSVGSIIGLFGTLGVSLGAVATGISSVLLPAVAVLAGGAAFGWLLMKIPVINTLLQKLGQGIYSLANKIPILSRVVSNLAEGWDILSGNSKKVNDSLSDSEKMLAAQQSLLKEYGAEVERGSMSLEEWHNAIREAAKQTDQSKKPIKELTDVIEDNADVSQKSAEEIDEWAGAIESAEKQFESLGGKVPGYTHELEDYNAVVRVGAKEDIPSLTDALGRSVTAFEAHRAELAKVEAEWQAFRGQVDLISSDSLPSVMTGVGKLPDAFKNSFTDAKKETKSFSDSFEKQVSTVVTNFAQAVGDMIWEWEDFGDALKNIGKKFISSLVSMFTENLFSSIFKSISGLFSGGSGGGGLLDSIGDWIKNALGGGNLAAGIANIAFPAVVMGGLFSQFFTDYQPDGKQPSGTYYQTTLEGTNIPIDPSMAGLSGADLSAITSNIPGQTTSIAELEGMNLQPSDIGLYNFTSWAEVQDWIDGQTEATKDNTEATEDATEETNNFRQAAENIVRTFEDLGGYTKSLINGFRNTGIMSSQLSELLGKVSKGAGVNVDWLKELAKTAVDMGQASKEFASIASGLSGILPKLDFGVEDFLESGVINDAFRDYVERLGGDIAPFEAYSALVAKIPDGQSLEDYLEGNADAQQIVADAMTEAVGLSVTAEELMQDAVEDFEAAVSAFADAIYDAERAPGGAFRPGDDGAAANALMAGVKNALGIDDGYTGRIQRAVDATTENTSAVEEATKGIREDLGIVKADMKRPTEYNINIDVRTLDAADFETVVKTRIIPELESAISTREFAVAGRTR